MGLWNNIQPDLFTENCQQTRKNINSTLTDSIFQTGFTGLTYKLCPKRMINSPKAIKFMLFRILLNNMTPVNPVSFIVNFNLSK